MKKQDIVNLIKFHSEKNEPAFRSAAAVIARELDRLGDSQLAAYIMSLISNAEMFVPQDSSIESPYLEKMPETNEPFVLPSAISDDILGIMNAVRNNSGMNKFLFCGMPGTGKTQAARYLGKMLRRDLFVVNYSLLIDCRLGQTQKNIDTLFKSINSLIAPERVVVLFDEIDALAMDRTDNRDLREMGRATTAFFKRLEEVNEKVVVVATTNLEKFFDKALMRRFDAIVDFNRYGRDDLLKVAEVMLDRYLNKIKLANRDVRLFRKVISLYPEIPMPGDLQNVIKVSVAFSDASDGYDYLRRLYKSACGELPVDAQKLKSQGFTVREISNLIGKPKSNVGRELQEAEREQST